MLSQYLTALSCLTALATARVTVNFKNDHGQPLMVTTQHTEGTWESADGAVSSGSTFSIADGDTLPLFFEHGFIGTAAVNTGTNTDIAGTKFEPSWSKEVVPPPKKPWMNVSMVDGYSVPMRCTCRAQTLGCGTELFKQGQCESSENPGNKLTGGEAGQPGALCKNGKNTPQGDGPANAFFAPCSGNMLAYTYPNEFNLAVECEDAQEMNCCIGENCTPSGGSSGGDQGEYDEEQNEGQYEEETQPQPTLTNGNNPTQITQGTKYTPPPPAIDEGRTGVFTIQTQTINGNQNGNGNGNGNNNGWGNGNGMQTITLDNGKVKVVPGNQVVQEQVVVTTTVINAQETWVAGRGDGRWGQPAQRRAVTSKFVA